MTKTPKLSLNLVIQRETGKFIGTFIYSVNLKKFDNHPGVGTVVNLGLGQTHVTHACQIQFASLGHFIWLNTECNHA